MSNITILTILKVPKKTSISFELPENDTRFPPARKNSKIPGEIFPKRRNIIIEAKTKEMRRQNEHPEFGGFH